MKEAVGSVLECKFKVDAICVPTNGIVKHNGELVMGAGLAKEFNDRFPGLAMYLGQHVNKNGNKVTLVTDQQLKCVSTPIFSLPTKYDYRQPATIELIEKSLEILVLIVAYMDWHRVVLPRLGCGRGGLDWKDVGPIMETRLDDRFCVLDKGK